MTIDPSGNSAYPYVIGPQYYGVAAPDNFGNGRVTITAPVKTCRGPTTGAADFAEAVPHEFALQQNFPNPEKKKPTLDIARKFVHLFP